MIINKVLDNVFSAKSSISILRAIQNTKTGLSGREVSRLAGLSARSAIITLTSLENLGIINKIRGGREHTFSLNREHYLVKNGILPVLEVERMFAESIHKDIKLKLRGKCRSIYLYGSVARKEEAIESDYDICITYSSANNRNDIEKSVYKLRSLLFSKYGVNISPFYITVSEFIKRAKKSKPPIPNILEEGKLIYGDSFHKMLND